MLKLKGLLITGTSAVGKRLGDTAVDLIIPSLFSELGCKSVKEAMLLLKTTYEQDAELTNYRNEIGELLLKRLHKGIPSDSNKFSPGGIYVFDADLFYNFSKDTMRIQDILAVMQIIGDGTVIRVVSKYHGMCKGRPVQPAYCRRIV